MSIHVHEVRAHNYAQHSPNKIHDDDVAARYGFKGGLVPGAADYAYLCQAVYKVFGDEWLHGGMMEAKFIKPIYHGEVARAQARSTDDDNRCELALLDPRGIVCSVGEAKRDAGVAPPHVDDYPKHPCLEAKDLPEPSVESFPAGYQLGSVSFVEDTAQSLAKTQEMFLEPLRGADGEVRWHPALCTHYGNEIVKANVKLGAWVHTASRATYFDAPRHGECVSIRGTVANTYVKRGHVMTECDLALFADDHRALVHLHHTAIIRLAAG